MRIIIYTGKGGVGKTSIAAATASHLANLGKKVLLLSTDQAHSLQDSLDHPLTYYPQEVFPNLEAMEIDSTEESKKAWGNLRDYLRQIISEKANGGLEAEEALLFPGLDEVFALLQILEIYQENRYDVLIVDCAPTGQSLSMLSYSEKLAMLADTILPMVKNVNSILGSFISKKTSVPKPRDAVFEEFESLVKRLNHLQEILHDKKTNSIRIVTTPEHIVLEEARRNYTWLQLYHFTVDAIYVNKIYPEKALEGYFENWKENQNKSLQIVEESFFNQKIFSLELQEEEIRGKDSLERISQLLYQGEDPSQIFYEGEEFKIEEKNGTRIFILPLPFTTKQDISVIKEEQDLLVTVLNETRRFRLPDKLQKRYISNYVLEDGNLKISMDYE